MQVRRLRIFPIESIVRGYITGSAWSEYQKSGTVHGMKVGEGLRESEAFPTAIWTPSTKAEMGEKDENISIEQGLLNSRQLRLDALLTSPQLHSSWARSGARFKIFP
jgi:phosphoribosylaminoimidazole-succinocarboxamide synthase